MILSVDINCSNKNIVKIIKKDLKEYGISPYHFKVNYLKKEQIKDNILLLEKDKIEWMEIEEHIKKVLEEVEEFERKFKEEEL